MWPNFYKRKFIGTQTHSFVYLLCGSENTAQVLAVDKSSLAFNFLLSLLYFLWDYVRLYDTDGDIWRDRTLSSVSWVPVQFCTCTRPSRKPEIQGDLSKPAVVPHSMILVKFLANRPVCCLSQPELQSHAGRDFILPTGLPPALLQVLANVQAFGICLLSDSN